MEVPAWEEGEEKDGCVVSVFRGCVEGEFKIEVDCESDDVACFFARPVSVSVDSSRRRLNREVQHVSECYYLAQSCFLWLLC